MTDPYHPSDYGRNSFYYKQIISNPLYYEVDNDHRPILGDKPDYLYTPLFGGDVFYQENAPEEGSPAFHKFIAARNGFGKGFFFTGPCDSALRLFTKSPVWSKGKVRKHLESVVQTRMSKDRSNFITALDTWTTSSSPFRDSFQDELLFVSDMMQRAVEILYGNLSAEEERRFRALFQSPFRLMQAPDVISALRAGAVTLEDVKKSAEQRRDLVKKLFSELEGRPYELPIAFRIEREKLFVLQAQLSDAVADKKAAAQR